MKFVSLPRFLRRRLQTSTSQSAKSLRLPRETHHFRPSSNPPRLPTFSQPSRTPAPATYFQHIENPVPATRNTLSTSKNVPSTWCFNDSNSKSLSHAGVVQILRSLTSKSAPNLSVFKDFDFQIALARRRGANFVDINFQKCFEPTVF